MKKMLILSMILMVFALGAYQANAQDKLTKKQRKEAKMLKAVEDKKALLEAVNDRTWVLEANTVYDRYGNPFFTTPSTNFIMINGDQSVIQLAFPFYFGYNGLGGITFDDRVSSYEVKEGNKPNSGINVNIQVSGVNIGNASVSISSTPDGKARATVYGPWGWRVTYQGNLVPLEESNVFEGQPLF